MRARRVVQLVIGSVLAVIGVPVLVAGLVLGWLYVVERDDDGWLTASAERLTTPTAAITSEDVDLGGDWGPFDGDLGTVRLDVDTVGEGALFVGIGPADDVAAYLDGVAHDIVVDGAFSPGDLELEAVAGSREPGPPTDQPFWVASGTGGLTWDVEGGEWTVVLMRADGGAGVAADVGAAVRLDWLGPATLGASFVGLLLLAAGVVLIVTAAQGATPAPAPTPGLPGTYPLRLDARLDEPLSRWRWLVKWLLAIPHLLVLIPLWIAFAVITVVAFFAILVTGRYPRSLFGFAVGVLRWTWRVGYYAFAAIGTDRYPPFSLASDPSYPTDLVVDPPERLSRGLVLVKWWLLALPHYVVVAILAGGFGLQVGGAVSALVLVAGIVLLVTRSYPKPLFDVIIGCDRWAYRVVAYAVLLTDVYPPFRFDAGGPDPGTVPAAPEVPPPAPPASPTGRELTGTPR